MTLAKPQPFARLRRLFRRARDNRGIAAVEFALIAPVMILAYLGSVETLQMIQIDRTVNLANYTVANLVTQYWSISTSQTMPDILAAGTTVMAPFPAANVSVVVTCISFDGSGKASVAWSQTLNGTARATVPTIPASLVVNSTSIIYAETTYKYTPTVDSLKLGTMNIKATLFMLPRLSTSITLAT